MSSNLDSAPANPIASDPNSPIISAKNISKSFDGRAVLQDISLEVKKGETIAVIGPSGCGKSTLLRILSDLDAPDSGSLTRASEDFTMVFQYSALFDSLSVFENVAFSLLEKSDDPGIKRRKVKKGEMHTMVAETLAMLGLEDIEHMYPNQLSGGMQKRVSFARAVIGNPQIIFYDEPTTGLDPITSSEISQLMLDIQKKYDTAAIIITHDIECARLTANRMIVLRDGLSVAEGTFKELENSNDKWIASFFK